MMGMPMMFWILLVAFFVLAGRRRRRWHAWREMRGYPYPAQFTQAWAPPHGNERPRAELESYVDSLESRVAHLEERLDFTERLVAGRPGEWKPASETARVVGSSGSAGGSGRVEGQA